MGKQTSEAPEPQVLLFSAQCLGTRPCCSGAGCRIQVYTSDTSAKISFAGKKRSKYSTCSLMHKQQAFHLSLKKNKTKPTLKKKWTMTSPANTFLKSSSCLCDRVPAPCLEERLWGFSHPASLPPSQSLCSSCLAVSLFRDCAKHNCTLFLMWPWSLSFTTIEPEGGNTTPLKILLKQCLFFFFFLNRAPFVCSVGYPAPNHTST